ncbi:erythromycin esterase [Nonomuraea polychroma]|uniref:Erythromycin esterase n=2 Tax=Nonomuraea polychroma TaxID=46176 RepID=A0A438MKD2_9ACTN|nr:erythromycin esterase [Nonomuraea polychroma]
MAVGYGFTAGDRSCPFAALHLRRCPSSTAPSTQLAAEGGGRLLLPTGAHLAAALGDDYRAIGVTSSHGRTAIVGEPTRERPEGTWYDAPLPPPTGSSIEAAFATGSLWTLANLRAARPHIDDAESFQQSRMADYFLDMPVFAAFDAIAHVSHTTGTDYVIQP